MYINKSIVLMWKIFPNLASNALDGIIKIAGGHADGESSSMLEYQIMNA